MGRVCSVIQIQIHSNQKKNQWGERFFIHNSQRDIQQSNKTDYPLELSSISLVAIPMEITKKIMNAHPEDYKLQVIMNSPEGPFRIRSGLLSFSNPLFVLEKIFWNKLLFEKHKTLQSAQKGFENTLSRIV